MAEKVSSGRAVIDSNIEGRGPEAESVRPNSMKQGKKSAGHIGSSNINAPA